MCRVTFRLRVISAFAFFLSRPSAAMIPRGCLMRVIDNSGARLAEVIGFYGQQGQYGYVGDVVKVAIKDAKGEKVQAGTTKKAVITGALKFCY